MTMVMDSKPKSPEVSKSATHDYEHVVGREFVRQYYTLLNESPMYLHRFYADNSSFVHGALDPVYERRDERSEKTRDVGIVYGQVPIHQRIMQLNFQDCKTKIRQVDAHATLGNGVVVQVSGELSNSGQPMRRFMQTFVLEPQGPKKFYVRNDIFRYQDEVFSVADACSSSANLDSDVQLSVPYSNYHTMIDSAQRQMTKPNACPAYYSEANVGQNGYTSQSGDNQAYEMLQGSNFHAVSASNGMGRERTTPAIIPDQPAVSEGFNSIGTFASLTMVETVPADSSTYISDSMCQEDSMMSANNERKSTETLPLIGEGWIKNNQESSEAEADHAMEGEKEDRDLHPTKMRITPDSSTGVSEPENQEELVAPENHQIMSSEALPVMEQFKIETYHCSDNAEADEKLKNYEEKEVSKEEQKQPSNVKEINEPKTYANLFKSGTSSSQAHILNVITGVGLPPAGFSKTSHVNSVGPVTQASSLSASSYGAVSQSSSTARNNSIQNEATSSPDRDGNKVTSMTQTQDSERYQGNSAGAAQPMRSGFTNRGNLTGFRGTAGRQLNASGNGTKDKFFPDSQQLFVGNLPNNCTEKELADLFCKFGNVAEVRIIHKAPSQQKFTAQGQRVPSFGFVVFEAESSVDQCLKSTPVLMDDGHRLNIESKKGKTSGDFSNFQGNSSAIRSSNVVYPYQAKAKTSQVEGYSTVPTRGGQGVGQSGGNFDKEINDNEDAREENSWTPRSARGRGRAGGARKM